MLGSDLKNKDGWLSFSQNAESIFKKYNINGLKFIEFLTQADEHQSNKQDLPNFAVKVETGVTTSIISMEEQSNFKPEITPTFISGLISSSRVLAVISLAVLLITFD